MRMIEITVKRMKSIHKKIKPRTNSKKRKTTTMTRAIPMLLMNRSLAVLMMKMRTQMEVTVVASTFPLL